MQEILLAGALLILVVSAVLVVITDKLLTAVVYAGILSAGAAFCYLLLGAPDVALAEAVIGSALSTIIFLVTLKKYRVFTVYLSAGGLEKAGSRHIVSLIEKVLQRQELEAHLLDAPGTAKELLLRPDCDLLLEEQEDRLVIYGEKNSKYLRLIEEELERSGLSGQVRFENSKIFRTASYKGGDV